MSIKIETYEGYTFGSAICDIEEKEDENKGCHFPPVITQIKEEKEDEVEFQLESPKEEQISDIESDPLPTHSKTSVVRKQLLYNLPVTSIGEEKYGDFHQRNIYAAGSTFQSHFQFINLNQKNREDIGSYTKQSRQEHKLFPCLHCNKVYKHRGTLFSHVKLLHKPEIPVSYICYHCGRSYQYKHVLCDHIKYVHIIGVKARYDCLQCGRFYSLQRALDTHIKHAHSPEGPVRYTCYHCGRSYEYKSGLFAHIRDNHLIRGKVMYACQHCDRIYSDKSTLSSHIKYNHSAEGKQKENVCKLCNKTYANPRSLKIHVRTMHTSEASRRFPCPECHKTYRRQSDSQSHFKAFHSQSAVGYTCKICDKVYSYSGALFRHMSQGHSNVGNNPVSFSCFLCKKVYKNRKSLNFHIKNVHSTSEL